MSNRREKFELSRAQKERERKERESRKREMRSQRVRVERSVLEYRYKTLMLHNLASFFFKRSVSVDYNFQSDFGTDVKRDDYSSVDEVDNTPEIFSRSRRMNRMTQQLDEINRKQSEQLAALKGIGSTGDSGAGVEAKTKASVEPPKQRSQRMQELEVNTDNGEILAIATEVIYNDYPEKSTVLRKASEQKRGFLVNTVRFESRPVTPILAYYATNMSTTFRCVTEDAFEDFHKLQPGRALLVNVPNTGVASEVISRYSSLDFLSATDQLRKPTSEVNNKKVDLLV